METFQFKILSDALIINLYAFHIRSKKDMSEFIYHGVTQHNDDDLIVNIGLPYGETFFKYKDHELSIIIREYQDIKGLNTKTAKHEEMYLYICAKNSETALEIFKDFIHDVKEYSKKY